MRTSFSHRRAGRITRTPIPFALFGIDEIGIEIEEPFGYDLNDRPVDAIGETIASDLRVAGETRLVS